MFGVIFCFWEDEFRNKVLEVDLEFLGILGMNEMMMIMRGRVLGGYSFWFLGFFIL